MASTSYHFIHVDFILFRFHIIILFVLLPSVMSFTSFNSYLLHVWHVRSYSKQTYTYTMTNRNISKSYQMHTRSNQTNTPFISFNYRFIKFSFSKASQPESPTRPGWRIQAGAWFTPTFSIIFSKHFVWFY